ncbi:MAG: N-acetylglucosamine transferase [Caulobacteraceae bacterium]|nr:N-acetylglucosamine transferase [Caulobacteraceae bacterium]
MAESLFLSVLQAVTAKQAGLGEVIGAASQLNAAGQSHLSMELYKVWIAVHAGEHQTYAAWFNLSVLQNEAGDAAGARESLLAAIAVDADFYPGYINLGGVLERMGDAGSGVEQWQTLVNRLPQVTGASIDYKLTAIKQIGRVLIDNKRSALAEAWLRQALDIDVGQREVLEQYTALRLAQCKWPVIEPWDRANRKALTIGVSPLSMAAYTDDPLLQLATAKRYMEAAIDERQDTPDADRRDAPIDLEGRRLRVGYISSDLREHAIGYLMAELFELHDKSKVEVFAYYCGKDPQGPMSDRIKAAVEHWIDINPMDDATAARRIAADGVDVLVDVNGLTRHARTAVFARRPAPVQVNWLGFPGSMGSPYHQYIIADDWIIPEENEIYYSEKVVRLPCYQSNDRKRVVAERPTRASVGLPEEAFVFCCFNGAQKFTRFHFDRWIEILRRTPASVLWLLQGDGDADANLAAYAEAKGIARERIVFAPKLTNAHHLARYALADLFLDTAPYGAHTTASDALWVGVPVLTLSGRSFAARVCGSLVRAAGLADMIVDTAEAYVERAVALASNPAEVAALKARLEANRSTCDLFNMDLLTERLEGLYHQMCADHQAGRRPQPDLRNLDVYLAIGCEIDHEAQEMRAAADYHGLYRAKLAERHRARPIPPDGRLWGEQD